MDGGPVSTVEDTQPLARAADMRPGQLLAVAAVVAAVLFGLAGLIGAVGYLITATREP